MCSRADTSLHLQLSLALQLHRELSASMPSLIFIVSLHTRTHSISAQWVGVVYSSKQAQQTFESFRRDAEDLALVQSLSIVRCVMHVFLRNPTANSSTGVVYVSIRALICGHCNTSFLFLVHSHGRRRACSLLSLAFSLSLSGSIHLSIIQYQSFCICLTINISACLSARQVCSTEKVLRFLDHGAVSGLVDKLSASHVSSYDFSKTPTVRTAMLS